MTLNVSLDESDHDFISKMNTKKILQKTMLCISGYFK